MGGPQQSAVMSDAAALALIGAHDAVTKTIQTEAAAETRAEETVVPEEHGGQYHGLWKAIPYESTPKPKHSRVNLPDRHAQRFSLCL